MNKHKVWMNCTKKWCNGVRQVPEGSGEQGKMEKTGCKIIYGAPTTLAVKGLMMMTMKLIKQYRQQYFLGPL